MFRGLIEIFGSKFEVSNLLASVQILLMIEVEKLRVNVFESCQMLTFRRMLASPRRAIIGEETEQKPEEEGMRTPEGASQREEERERERESEREPEE